MINQEAEGESSMTISAQVIDTIVVSKRWPAMRVTRNGTCSGCLCNTKGRVWGAISVNASCCWRRGICANQTPGYTTSACVTGLTRSRPSLASSPARSTSRLGRIVKRTTAGHTELFYPVAVSPDRACITLTTPEKTSGARRNAARRIRWRRAVRTTRRTKWCRAG